MIIAPLKQFLIDYKINNPSDTDTHYVRAVIKNAISGVTIDTLNLTDNGSGYFSKVYITPADMTGTGFQISILKTVYDDSGYTSESLVYGTTLENYIVRDLAGSRTMLGGSGASSQQIDYEKVKSIVEEVVKNLPQPAQPQPTRIIVKDKNVELVGEINSLNKKIASLISNLKNKTEGKQSGIEDIKKMLHSYLETSKTAVDQINTELESQKNNTKDLQTKMNVKVDIDFLAKVSESLISSIEGFGEQNIEKFAQLIKLIRELGDKAKTRSLIRTLIPSQEDVVEKDVKEEVEKTKPFSPRESIKKLLFSTI